MEDSQLDPASIKFEGSRAYGGNSSVIVNTLDATTLLATIPLICKILKEQAAGEASSKEQPASPEIETDLYRIVREHSELKVLCQETDARLQETHKKYEYLKQKADAVKAKESALDALKEKDFEIRDAHKVSEEGWEKYVKHVVATNKNMAETIEIGLASYITIKDELNLFKKKVETMAMNHKSDKEIFEKEKQELRDTIQALQIELARSPRLDVATEPSELSEEEVKELQQEKEKLNTDITNAKNDKEKSEREVRRLEDKLTEDLSDAEKALYKQLLNIEKDKLAAHQTKFNDFKEKLRICVGKLQKEDQRQSSADSSTSGGNSHSSAGTEASTNTTLSKLTSRDSDIGPENVAKTRK